MKVLTTAGEIEMAELEVCEVVEMGDNHRKLLTQYRHQGELVRQDVNINILRPFQVGVSEGNIRG